MSRKKDFKKDFSGEIFELLYKKRMKYLAKFYTLLTKIDAKLRGIKMGKGGIYWGSPFLLRYPNSSIEIGNNVNCRSLRMSNPMGLNHRCMLVTVAEGAVIKIGDGVRLSGTAIGAAEYIEIGKNVMCGVNTELTDTDWHSLDPDNRSGMTGGSAPIIIKDNVLLGMNVMVLKGVTIGENSYIAANSLVTRDIPANVLAGGSPAKVLKTLAELLPGEVKEIVGPT